MSTVVGNAPQRVIAGLQHDFEQFVHETCGHLSNICESPIEVMLGAALIGSCYFLHPDFLTLVKPGWPEPDKSKLMLKPQYSWGGYRFDFLLQLKDLAVIVECDGHDFHERTKAQAESDRKRDRLVQEAGWPVLRFTGSEIVRNPSDCASQVLKFLASRINK